MKERVKEILKASSLGKVFYPYVQACYRAVAIPLKRRRLQRLGKEMLGRLHEVLDANGIDYYLDFGTLLGLVRENNFIKHDDDIDLTIIDRTIEARSLLKTLLSEGFVFIHALTVRGRVVEFSVSYKKLSADFYFYIPITKAGNVGVCDVYFDPSVKYDNPNENNYKVWFIPDGIRTKIVQFMGVDVRIPECPEKILEIEYGKDWRTPIKNWSADKLDDRYQVMEDFAVRLTDIKDVIKE